MDATLARAARRGLVAALFAAAAAAPLPAQFVEPPAPAAYALRNVIVVSADGTRTPGMDVVVRGARIEALGRGLAIPADALELTGDSLLVYPGIVDAWGAVKFEFPKDSLDRARIRSWDPPRAAHGFLPHRRVLDVLTPTGEELRKLRQQGVIAVAVHPTEGLMPGQGALLLLRDTAVGASGLAIRPVLGPVATFRGTRGMYPTTGMAIPSFFRQAFLDATRAAQVASATPRGAVPPPFDADYAVIQEALAGTTPLFFVADQAEQIRHVLRFADEYRIRPIILGGAEAWMVADELERRDIPVLVSLDWPKPVRWNPKKPDSATAPAAVRERREHEARFANAGKLAAAGVRVALTSGGKADIREAARRVIEHGMSESDALRAVTLTPARLFGFDRLASVAQGGAATFIVTDGPLFGEKTKVRYTFVEGRLEKGADARAARDTTSRDSARIDVTGAWEFEAEAGAGDAISGDMNLVVDGENVTGTIELGELGTAAIRTGTLEGRRLNLTLAVTAGGQSFNVELSGTVERDRMTGTGTGPTGPFEWSATRTPEGLR